MTPAKHTRTHPPPPHPPPQRGGATAWAEALARAADADACAPLPAPISFPVPTRCRQVTRLPALCRRSVGRWPRISSPIVPAAEAPMPITNVHRISAASPDDVSGIEAAIAAGRIDPKGIIAIFGKTEGNGLVNDFSRGFANQSLLAMLRNFLPAEAARQVCLVMSGGTEGAMAPHWGVFERRAGGGADAPALAVGRAHTPVLAFENLGRLAQVDMVAEGVRAAMVDAGVVDLDGVHFVQVQCPLLTVQRVAEADRR